jgi:hypothetical protein
LGFKWRYACDIHCPDCEILCLSSVSPSNTVPQSEQDRFLPNSTFAINSIVRDRQKSCKIQIYIYVYIIHIHYNHQQNHTVQYRIFYTPLSHGEAGLFSACCSCTLLLRRNATAGYVAGRSTCTVHEMLLISSVAYSAQLHIL